MNFYDIVSETCELDNQFVKRLGFKRIFTVNKEVRAAGHGDENEHGLKNAIAFGKDKNQLIALAKHGAAAVAVTDSYIDRKLIKTMKDNGCVLCIPMGIITASYGIERARNIYKTGKLYAYARKQGIDVIFVSMSKNRLYMNSYAQLIELAKLVGAEEKYARHSMSEITKAIVSE